MPDIIVIITTTTVIIITTVDNYRIRERRRIEK